MTWAVIRASREGWKLVRDDYATEEEARDVAASFGRGMARAVESGDLNKFPVVPDAEGES